LQKPVHRVLEVQQPLFGACHQHRAHRIGPTRPVFAYRLIARNTVEEKVLGCKTANARSPTPS